MRTARELVAAGVLGALLAAAGGTAQAAPPVAQAQDDVVWLCHPDMTDDPCEIPLDTTVREPDGTERVETPARPPQDARPVDCFYVYPTVSNQPTPSSDKRKDPELASIAKYQAAPFSSQCRVFAPVYRQATLASIAGERLGVVDRSTLQELAYSDVVAAWQQYLAEDNGGRGVVLLGHSQGTRMLRGLIKREIDQRPEVRRLLVGAVLLGGNVTVAQGSTTGGDFVDVPVCTRAGEAGCVVAFSTYAEDPPANSRFGVATADPVFGTPGGPGFEAACTDPGVLSGQSGPVGITVPTEPFAPGLILGGIVITNGGPPPVALTTFVRPADRFQGSCRTVAGANVLRYDPVGTSRRPNPYPDPTWGTHLIDVNYGLERQVAIVAAQARTWLAAQPATAAPPAAAPPAAAPPAAAPPAAARAAAPAPARALPATGADAALPLLAVVLLVGAVGTRRLRTR